MKAIRGNTSIFTPFFKLFRLISIPSETHHFNCYGTPNLLRIRLFSSFGGHNKSRQGRTSGGRNDFNGGRNDSNGGRNDYDDNSNFSGRNRGKFSAQQSYENRGINSRGDRQRSQFGGQNAGIDRDYRGRGRGDDGFSKRSRPHLGLGDDFLKFDDNGEGSGGKGKKDYQPSVRELVNHPFKGEKHGENESNNYPDCAGKEDSRSNEVHSDPSTQDDRMEAPEGAAEIFNKMKKSGLIPNAVAMLDGLCKDGLVHEAMKLFGLMRETGTMPEVVVYTGVVEGFCQARKLDDAKRIFKKMQDSGIVPNAFSYTVLIKGLCKATRLEDAIDFCVEMLEAGHSPNVPTFTGLVLELCKDKGVEDAQKAVEMLKQKGFFLDEKAVRVYLDKTGPTSPLVWEAIFGPKKTTQSEV